MNELKDKDLREALCRREARRTKTEVPADFCDNIMREIAPKPVRRVRYAYIAALATAACIAIAVLMVWPTDGEQKSDGSGLTVRSLRTHSPKPKNLQPVLNRLSRSFLQKSKCHSKSSPRPLTLTVLTTISIRLNVNWPAWTTASILSAFIA